MATSGSYDYNRTRSQLVNGALRLCRALGRGRTASADEEANAVEAMNMMFKSWSTQGLKLWKQKDAYLFVQKGTSSYAMGSWHVTESYSETTLGVAASSGASTITVASVSGIATTYYIGVELDGGTIHWTTVNGAPSGLVVTLTDALTDDCALGNTVFCYQTKAPRPLRIIDARRYTSTNEIPVDVISRNEYNMLPNKSQTGIVNQVYYHPTLSTGNLHIWNTGDTATDILKMTMLFPIEDMDASGNDPDFPQEWLEAIKYGLASRLGPEYGIPLQRQSYLDNMAEMFKEQLMDWDAEETSITIAPR